MTGREIESIAPNVLQHSYLMRPTPGFASPHICELHDLRTKYTIDDLANFHEILDLREAAEDKARKHIEAEQSKQRGGRRPR